MAMVMELREAFSLWEPKGRIQDKVKLILKELIEIGAYKFNENGQYEWTDGIETVSKYSDNRLEDLEAWVEEDKEAEYYIKMCREQGIYINENYLLEDAQQCKLFDELTKITRMLEKESRKKGGCKMTKTELRNTERRFNYLGKLKQLEGKEIDFEYVIKDVVIQGKATVEFDSGFTQFKAISKSGLSITFRIENITGIDSEFIYLKDKDYFWYA